MPRRNPAKKKRNLETFHCNYQYPSNIQSRCWRDPAWLKYLDGDPKMSRIKKMLLSMRWKSHSNLEKSRKCPGYMQDPKTIKPPFSAFCRNPGCDPAGIPIAFSMEKLVKPIFMCDQLFIKDMFTVLRNPSSRHTTPDRRLTSLWVF